MNEELREALGLALEAVTAVFPGPPPLRILRGDLGWAADAVLALPEVAALLADAERVRRVRDALDEVAAYAQGIADQLDMSTAEYGPSEWRLHGDARGHRLAVSEIRRALDGDRP